MRDIPREIVLQPFTFMDVQRFSANPAKVVCDDGLAAMRCIDTDEIEVRFRLAIMSTEPQHVSARWPATWWDAVKERFVPTRLRRWLPVRTNYVHVERAGLYPEIPWEGRGALMAIPYLSESRGTDVDRGASDDD